MLFSLDCWVEAEISDEPFLLLYKSPLVPQKCGNLHFSSLCQSPVTISVRIYRYLTDISIAWFLWLVGQKSSCGQLPEYFILHTVKWRQEFSQAIIIRLLDISGPQGLEEDLQCVCVAQLGLVIMSRQTKEHNTGFCSNHALFHVWLKLVLYKNFHFMDAVKAHKQKAVLLKTGAEILDGH